MNNKIIEKEGKLYFQSKDADSIKLLVDRVISKGWKEVKISGDEKLKQVFILESAKKGINILENNIKIEPIKLPASKVALEYEESIIPKLKLELSKLKKIRKEQGINTTELDRVYNLNALRGEKKALDDKFFKIKHTLEKAMIDFRQFKAFGDLNVEVKRAIDSRYVLANSAAANSESRGIKNKLSS